MYNKDPSSTPPSCHCAEYWQVWGVSLPHRTRSWCFCSFEELALPFSSTTLFLSPHSQCYSMVTLTPPFFPKCIKCISYHIKNSLKVFEYKCFKCKLTKCKLFPKSELGFWSLSFVLYLDFQSINNLWFNNYTFNYP